MRETFYFRIPEKDRPLCPNPADPDGMHFTDFMMSVYTMFHGRILPKYAVVRLEFRTENRDVARLNADFWAAVWAAGGLGERGLSVLPTRWTRSESERLVVSVEPAEFLRGAGSVFVRG